MKKFEKFLIPEVERPFKGEVKDYKDPKYFDDIFSPNKIVGLPISERVEWGVNIKTGQHSKYYDLMIIQYGSEAIPTLGELTKEEGESLINISVDIAEDIYQKPETEITLIDWNISPKEFTRKHPQTVKRIHFHITGITKEEIDKNFEEVEFSSLSKEDLTKERNLFNDPFTGVFCEIMQKDIMSNLKGAEDIFVLENQKSRTKDFPIGFEIELKNGLDTLQQKEFFSIIQDIHNQIEEKENNLSSIFTSGELDENDRPRLLSKNEINHRLKEFTKENNQLDYTKNFLKKLSVFIKDADQVPNSEWLMKGMGYSAAIYSDKRRDNKWRLVIAPRIVSGVGALEIFGIKLLRTTELKFSEEESSRQNYFRKEVLEKITETYKDKAKKGKLGLELEESFEEIN